MPSCTTGYRPHPCSATQRKIDDLRTKVAQYERARDTQKVADLKFYAIPELEKKLERLQTTTIKPEDRLLTETVGPEQVAEIVSRWTGIPVTKLTASDRERLLNLPQHLHERIVGQDDAVNAVAEAIIRIRGGLGDPNRCVHTRD